MIETYLDGNYGNFFDIFVKILRDESLDKNLYGKTLVLQLDYFSLVFHLKENIRSSLFTRFYFYNNLISLCVSDDIAILKINNKVFKVKPKISVLDLITHSYPEDEEEKAYRFLYLVGLLENFLIWHKVSNLFKGYEVDFLEVFLTHIINVVLEIEYLKNTVESV